ncbi:MAG: LytTR family DNA-binding domain-containing protein [Bacteroidota bacterium]
MKPITYLIVDDQEIDRLTIEALAAAFPFLQKIATCSQPLEALELIDKTKPDIIFADIEMPGISGLELVRAAGSQVPAPVFITSHPEFALDSYELDAFDYLLKPVNKERFEKCASRLLEFFQLRANAFAFEQEQESDYIMIKQGHDTHRLRLQDILYLEAMKDYTAFVTATRKYLVLATLVSMQEKLAAGKFTRIHRSYIVNTSRIDAWKGNKVSIGIHELPVGKLYKNVLNEMRGF